MDQVAWMYMNCTNADARHSFVALACLSTKNIPGKGKQQPARDHAVWRAPHKYISVQEIMLQHFGQINTCQLQSYVWQHQLHYITVDLCYRLLFTFPHLVDSCIYLAHEIQLPAKLPLLCCAIVRASFAIAADCIIGTADRQAVVSGQL